MSVGRIAATLAEDRPPLAVVGSQISQEENLFGRVFDKSVVWRLGSYLKPYRGRLAIGIAAVLVFTLTQLSIPLVIRSAIDDAVVQGADGRTLLDLAVIVFFAVVTVNYLANHLQEAVVGRIASHLLFDLRRAMSPRPGEPGPRGARLLVGIQTVTVTPYGARN